MEVITNDYEFVAHIVDTVANTIFIAMLMAFVYLIMSDNDA